MGQQQAVYGGFKDYASCIDYYRKKKCRYDDRPLYNSDDEIFRSITYSIKNEKDIRNKAEMIVGFWLAFGDSNIALDLSFLDLVALPKIPDMCRKLDCSHNKLSAILSLNVVELICRSNKLAKLGKLDNCEYLDCDNNCLDKLPDLPKCRELHCSNNKLTSLANLLLCRILCCRRNRIQQIPNLPECASLECCNNNISEIISVPKCSELLCRENKIVLLANLNNCKHLNCGNNMLIKLPELPACETLYCYQNKLIELPHLLPLCKILICYKNNLTKLPDMPECNLIECYDNKIRQLGKYGDKPKCELRCWNNQLTDMAFYKFDEIIMDAKIYENLSQDFKDKYYAPHYCNDGSLYFKDTYDPLRHSKDGMVSLSMKSIAKCDTTNAKISSNVESKPQIKDIAPIPGIKLSPIAYKVAFLGAIYTVTPNRCNKSLVRKTCNGKMDVPLRHITCSFGPTQFGKKMIKIEK